MYRRQGGADVSGTATGGVRSPIAEVSSHAQEGTASATESIAAEFGASADRSPEFGKSADQVPERPSYKTESKSSVHHVEESGGKSSSKFSSGGASRSKQVSQKKCPTCSSSIDENTTICPYCKKTLLLNNKYQYG